MSKYLTNLKNWLTATDYADFPERRAKILARLIISVALFVVFCMLGLAFYLLPIPVLITIIIILCFVALGWAINNED